MSAVSLSLPELRSANRCSLLEVRLESSICLDLPRSFQQITTFEQLRDAVFHDHLWIARVGTCALSFDIAFGDDIQPQARDLTGITSTILQHEVRGTSRSCYVR
jgi:hypothetical protein